MFDTCGVKRFIQEMITFRDAEKIELEAEIQQMQERLKDQVTGLEKEKETRDLEGWFFPLICFNSCWIFIYHHLHAFGN